MDNWIIADVEFDSSEDAREAERLAREGKMPGVSADIADVTATLEVLDVDEYGAPKDWLETITEGEIIGATQIAMPAFADAQIIVEDGRLVARVVPEGTVTSDRRFIEPGSLSWRDPAPLMFINKTTDGHADAVFVGNLTNFRRDGTLVAAGSWRPPKAWFETEEPDYPTPLTISDDGRLFGHLAEWQTCHIGYGEACVTAPLEHTAGYPYFHTGQVVCDNGDTVAVGQITLGTGHADGRLGHKPAVDHYDNTGTAVADVCAYQGQHGIWLAGAIRPTATEDQIETLRRASLSGDWRRIGTILELVAALAVNVPGFAVARVASGEQTALVAAGIVSLRDEVIERLAAEVIKLREQVDELRRPAQIQKAKQLAERFNTD